MEGSSRKCEFLLFWMYWTMVGLPATLTCWGKGKTRMLDAFGKKKINKEIYQLQFSLLCLLLSHILWLFTRATTLRACRIKRSACDILCHCAVVILIFTYLDVGYSFL